MSSPDYYAIPDYAIPDFAIPDFALPGMVTAEDEVSMGTFDAVLASNVEQELAVFDEPVIVYPPGAAARSVTGIVTRKALAVENDPRQQMAVLTVQLPNSATTGISGSEWNNRFELGVPRYAGGPAVRVRTVRAVQQDAAMITWEVV